MIDRDRSVSLGIAIALLAALPFALVAVLPTMLSAEALGPWTREDGIVEWVGAGAWLLASFLFAGTVLTRRKSGTSTALNIFLLSGLALMSFLAAGEEISWGQRLLGYATPDIVAQNNLQKEMNFHNLVLLDNRLAVDGEQKSGVSRWFTFGRLGSLIWMGYLVVLPLTVRCSRLARVLVERMGLSVPPLGIALAGTVAYVAFFTLIASLAESDAHYQLTRVSANEVKESVVALLFLCTAYAFFRNRHRRLAAADGESAVSPERSRGASSPP